MPVMDGVEAWQSYHEGDRAVTGATVAFVTRSHEEFKTRCLLEGGCIDFVSNHSIFVILGGCLQKLQRAESQERKMLRKGEEVHRLKRLGSDLRRHRFSNTEQSLNPAQGYDAALTRRTCLSATTFNLLGNRRGSVGYS
jgi:hypothetical protein